MILAAANTFRAGLVQLRSGRAIAPNMEMAEALIRRAAAEGAVYVLTPENTSIMELETDRLLAAIDTEEKSAPLRQLQALAKELGIWLHVGSLAMKLPSGKVANRSYLIMPQGEIAARYDKLHMFDVDLAGGESYREVAQFRPGRQSGACRPALGEARLEHLLRPSLSRALPGARICRRRCHCRACRLYQADRRRALAGAVARPRHRDRRLRPRRSPRRVA